MWTVAFWKGAGERAIKTFFQSFGAALAVSAAGSAVGVMQVDWLTIASISVVATILSFVTSIGNADFTAGVTKGPVVDNTTTIVNQTTPGGGAPLIGA